MIAGAAAAIDLLRAAIAVGLWVIPAWLVTRKVAATASWPASFIFAVVGLTNMVMLFSAVSIPLAPWSLCLGWMLVCGTLYLVLPRHRPAHSGDSGLRSLDPIDRWLFLPAVPGLVVLLYRATTQALFGIDTVFRWDYLAREMAQQQSLEFYPPTLARHFKIYSWPDGIAPAVSSIYLWIYDLSGKVRPLLTAPAVALQYAIVLTLVYFLGRKYFSPRAGVAGVAVLASSPIAVWATAMGQETGLLTSALLAMLYYLPRQASEEQLADVAIAALAAGMGGLAREYGLAFPVFGLALAATRKLSRRALIVFAITAALACGPWYLRNWMRTGNPLYGIDLAGLFPNPAVHAWLMKSIALESGWPAVPPRWSLFLSLTLGPVAVLSGAGLGLIRPRPYALLAGVGLGIIIWCLSVPYTAAGFINSTRVLSPALVVGAVVGGATFARLASTRRRRLGGTVVLLVFSLPAALQALTLPAPLYRVPPREWLRAGNGSNDYHALPLFNELARWAGAHGILTLGPDALLTSKGATTVPLWSPDVHFLFEPLPAPEVARRLRSRDIAFVLLTKGRINERLLAHSPFLTDPQNQLKLLWTNEEMAFWAVRADPGEAGR